MIHYLMMSDTLTKPNLSLADLLYGRQGPGEYTSRDGSNSAWLIYDYYIILVRKDPQLASRHSLKFVTTTR